MNAIPAKKVKCLSIVAKQKSHYACVRASLEDVKVGKVKKFKTAADLLKALDAGEAA